MCKAKYSGPCGFNLLSKSIISSIVYFPKYRLALLDIISLNLLKSVILFIRPNVKCGINFSSDFILLLMIFVHLIILLNFWSDYYLSISPQNVRMISIISI